MHLAIFGIDRIQPAVAAADEDRPRVDRRRVPDRRAGRHRPGQRAVATFEGVDPAVGTSEEHLAAVRRARVQHRPGRETSRVLARLGVDGVDHPGSVPTNTLPSATTGCTPVIKPSSGNRRYHLRANGGRISAAVAPLRAASWASMGHEASAACPVAVGQWTKPKEAARRARPSDLGEQPKTRYRRPLFPRRT